MQILKERSMLKVLVAFILFLAIIYPVSASMQSDFLSLVNTERARVGSSPLYENTNLQSAAYDHSLDMATNHYFSHTSLNGDTFVTRIRAAGYLGYSAIGENIAYNYGSADANVVYTMWKNSAGHYANMISKSFNEAGLGVYSAGGYTYYTLDLGKRTGFVPSNNSLNYTLPQNNVSVNNTQQPPIVNNSSNGSISNTSLVLNINMTKRTQYYYKYFNIIGKTNNRALISYQLFNQTRTICSSCSSFSLSIGTSIYRNLTLNVFAKDTSGNVVKKEIFLY